jgi:prepilin-type N-terminal cleavage/methylation domain-containing protein
MRGKNGFTIIELLVVIATIGILAAIVLNNVTSYMAKARDIKRMQDLRSVRIALQMYYSANGRYPVISKWATSEQTTLDSDGSKWAALQTALAPYLSNLPGDPKPAGTGGPWATGNYHYAYSCLLSNCQSYDLIAQLENTSNVNTCQYRCWKYHQGEGAVLPESSWCSACPDPHGTYSPYLYADH